MGQSLYHYTAEFLEVKAGLEALDLNAEDFSDVLESYEDNIAAKMENVIKYQKELLALASVQVAEAKLLTEAAKAKEVKAEALRVYMDQTMKAIGSTSLQAGAYSLGYKKGSESTVVDESSLPKEYWVKQPDKPMGKPELKKLIKAGTKIEGVQLVRAPDSLVIKV